MANEALDIVGYTVVNSGETSGATADLYQCFIPMVAGSQFIDDPALLPEEIAQGLADVIAWTQGVTIPALLVRAPLFGGLASHNWFIKQRLIKWLRQNTTTGMIAANGDTLQFKFADETARRWTRFELGSFRLDWGGDSPVMATMLFMIGGAVESPVSPATSATGIQNTGPYFMSQGVTYNSKVTDVVAGSLSINTRMVPDITTPLATAPDTTDGTCYPNQFLSSGPPIVTLSLTQKKGAATIVDDGHDKNVQGEIDLRFNDIPGTGYVQFSLTGLRPPRTRPIARGLATVTRGYRNIMPDVSTRSWDIDGS